MWQKKPLKRTEEVCFGSPVKHNKTKKQAKIDDIYKLCFMLKKTVQQIKDRVINANAHLAHLQAQAHRLILQLAKKPNLCRRTIKRDEENLKNIKI